MGERRKKRRNSPAFFPLNPVLGTTGLLFVARAPGGAGGGFPPLAAACGGGGGAAAFAVLFLATAK